MNGMYPKFNAAFKSNEICVSLMHKVPRPRIKGMGYFDPSLDSIVQVEETLLWCIGGGQNERDAKAAAIRNLRAMIKQIQQLPVPPEANQDFQI